MSGLPWSASWYQAGMSLWAVACKIAFASTADVKSVLSFLVGASAAGRGPMLFRRAEVVRRVTADLGLTAEQGDDLFLGPPPKSLYDREHARFGLRWCPECLVNWYHSARFQDAQLRLCPWHQCRILNECPYCSRIIDPLGAQPWTCSACHKTLAAPPTNWLENFKARPMRPEVLLPGTRLLEQRAPDGQSVWCPIDTNFVAPATASDMYDSGYWRMSFMFEDACAVWETAAAGHRECIHCEPQSIMTQYESAPFKCPVAAGMLQATSQSGVRTEERGEWQRWRALPTAEWNALAPSELPLSLVPVFMREVGRLRMVDAIQKLSELAESGRDRSFWRMPAAVPTHSTSAGGVLFSGLATEQHLLKAIRRGTKSCPQVRLKT